MPAERISVRIAWVVDGAQADGGDAHRVEGPRVDARSAQSAIGDGQPHNRSADSPAIPRVVQRIVEIPSGATIIQALEAWDALEAPDERKPAAVPIDWRGRIADGLLAVAVFGRPAASTTVLQANDRIELVGPLSVDPKQARQRRAQQQREASGDARWRRRPEPV